MRKIFAIAAVTILFAVSTNAQTFFNFGYGLGSDKATFGSLEADKSNSNTLFAGISRNFGIAGNFGIEPGVNYIFNFSKIGDELCVKNQHHGLQVPVLLNYAFVSSSDFALKLFAGPSVNFGLSDKSTTYVGGTKGLVIDNYADDSYSRFGVSASFGLGAELCNTVRFKIGYDLGLSDLDKSDNITYKQNLLTFSLGYIF
ncbi:MAG: PorT family protein [Bacteroidales bacterium]|nr:PorT family protein [Candidatus Cacconaster merdequi]